MPTVQVADKITLDKIHSLAGAFGSFKTSRIYNTRRKVTASMTPLPYAFYNGSAVVYRGEIHILGGSDPDNGRSHYKFDMKKLRWVSVSKLPVSFTNGAAVVYNDTIHILGGNDSLTAHYAWDGESWVSVATLPFEFRGGCANVWLAPSGLLLINLFGTANSSPKSHYMFTGTSWEWGSTLLYENNNGSTVVFDGDDGIHLLGGYNTDTSTGQTTYNDHLYYNGVWKRIGDLPYPFYTGDAVILNNKIHILGSFHNKYFTSHYKWLGFDDSGVYGDWKQVSVLPRNFYGGSALVFNNQIHTIGSFSTEDKIDYIFDGTTWGIDAIVEVDLEVADVCMLYPGAIVCCDTDKVNVYQVSAPVELVENGYKITGVGKVYINASRRDELIYSII